MLASLAEYTSDAPIPYGEDFLVREVCSAVAATNPSFSRPELLCTCTRVPVGDPGKRPAIIAPGNRPVRKAT